MSRADDSVARRAYVDDLTFWKRAGSPDVVESVVAALDATKRFEAAMDWELNSSKSRLWANAAAFRRWLAAEGGGVPAATTFKDLG
eukprot:401478-Lingulodinium_polyedra.AAC.1